MIEEDSRVDGLKAEVGNGGGIVDDVPDANLWFAILGSGPPPCCSYSLHLPLECRLHRVACESGCGAAIRTVYGVHNVSECHRIPLNRDYVHRANPNNRRIDITVSIVLTLKSIREVVSGWCDLQMVLAVRS